LLIEATKNKKENTNNITNNANGLLLGDISKFSGFVLGSFIYLDIVSSFPVNAWYRFWSWWTVSIYKSLPSVSKSQ
jgi:hypothetical protein